MTMLLVSLGVLSAALVSACGDTPADPDIAAPAPVVAPTVHATYPHDSTAFTQGLVWDAGVLLEGTGIVGRSELRESNLASGEVARRTPLPPPHFGEGIAVQGGLVYQLTWRTGQVFVYDRATLALRDSLPLDREGWGITSDGTALWTSDGSDVLRIRDPATFAVRRTLTVVDGGRRITGLNELEWVRGELWANVYPSERIARIDPASGLVIAWIDIGPLYPRARRSDGEAVPNGIAWDRVGDRVFVTGKLWPVLFEIR